MDGVLLPGSEERSHALDVFYHDRDGEGASLHRSWGLSADPVDQFLAGTLRLP
jgi:hypothetical protein